MLSRVHDDDDAANGLNGNNDLEIKKNEYLRKSKKKPRLQQYAVYTRLYMMSTDPRETVSIISSRRLLRTTALVHNNIHVVPNNRIIIIVRSPPLRRRYIAIVCTYGPPPPRDERDDAVAAGGVRSACLLKRE